MAKVELKKEEQKPAEKPVELSPEEILNRITDAFKKLKKHYEDSGTKHELEVHGHDLLKQQKMNCLEELIGLTRHAKIILLK